MKSVINSYRLQPGPTPPTIAGRIVPVAPPTSYRRALVVLAALLLPLLAIGVVVYAARQVQPRETQAPAAPIAAPSPVVIERVVQVTAPPVVVVVTATPAPAPVQVAPVAPRQAAPPAQAQAPSVQRQPQPAPTQNVIRNAKPAAPVVGGPVRAAGVPTILAPTPNAGPQQRLLSRDCVNPAAPQGTVIKGYFTDAQGVKRDAICTPAGWKAVQ